jgi:hypothetical protein
MAGTVIFLGAGATKACDGPLTNEILPNILKGKYQPVSPVVAGSVDRINLLENFLTQQFHVTANSPIEHYPALPLLMSLIDVALDRRQPLNTEWDLQRVSELREAIEVGIFDHLEERLFKAPTNNHWKLIQKIYEAPNEPVVISTNYDLIIDTAMMSVSETRFPEGKLPNYHCQIRTPFYREQNYFGTLLKLHGSLNWLSCRACHRLEIGASESRRYLKVLARLVGPSLEASYTAGINPCPTCGTKLRPFLIAPTHLKNYRNPHVAQVWYEAERVLRDATRVIFIGYSLPDDDLEVIYLLKRSMAHLQPHEITVVDYDEEGHPALQNTVGRRYRSLFGDGIDWHPEGLDAWL